MREHICGRNNGRVERRIRRRILVVDDDLHCAQMLRAILSDEGHDAQVATQSLRVFDAAKAFGPDLILMDVVMPHLDGFDQIKLLGLDERLGIVPVILITARRGALDGIDDLHRLPIVDCVYKPLDHAVLLASIAAAPLRQRRPAKASATDTTSALIGGRTFDHLTGTEDAGWHAVRDL